MTKVINFKSNKKVIKKIVLYSFDGLTQTRYILAQIKKDCLQLRYAYFNHLLPKCKEEYFCIVQDENLKQLLRILDTDLDSILEKISEKFCDYFAFSDFIVFLLENKIKHKIQELNAKRYDLDGILDDSQRLYYDNGALIIPDLFKHPKNGLMKIYSADGKLYMSFEYKDNKKDGEVIYYLKNGNKKAVIMFKNGELV